MVRKLSTIPNPRDKEKLLVGTSSMIYLNSIWKYLQYDTLSNLSFISKHLLETFLIKEQLNKCETKKKKHFKHNNFQKGL